MENLDEIQRDGAKIDDFCFLEHSPVNNKLLRSGFSLTPRPKIVNDNLLTSSLKNEENLSKEQRTPEAQSLKRFFPTRPKKGNLAAVQKFHVKTRKKLPLDSVTAPLLSAAADLKAGRPESDLYPAEDASCSHGSTSLIPETPLARAARPDLKSIAGEDPYEESEELGRKKLIAERDGKAAPRMPLSELRLKSPNRRRKERRTLLSLESSPCHAGGLLLGNSSPWSGLSGFSPLSQSNRSEGRGGRGRLRIAKPEERLLGETLSIRTSTPLHDNMELDWEEMSTVTDGASENSGLPFPQESRFVCSSDIFSSQESSTDESETEQKEGTSNPLEKWGSLELFGSDKENVDPLLTGKRKASPIDQVSPSFACFPSSQPCSFKGRVQPRFRWSLSQPPPSNLLKQIQTNKRFRLTSGLDHEDESIAVESEDLSPTEEEVKVRRCSSIEEAFFCQFLSSGKSFSSTF